MNESTDSQNAHILLHLRQGKTITGLEALRLFGSQRLSARIYDLKKRDINIDKKWKRTLSGKNVAEYFIVKP